ncbi:MAG: hypothetical protein JNG82_03390 [Opitutaceae bacterium]|nr:hypothetical protein [Opitutaceae bacterium]
MTRRLLLSALFITAGLHAQPPGPLEQNFLSPPEAARPWVYWYFMDGNMTREGMTADLEAMRDAGIGGVIFLEVDLGQPRGPVGFMTPAWREHFAHAVHEAERLGIEVALGSGPGWCGTGGPWVRPENSMQHLVASETHLLGPQKFNGILPRPQPRKPFFGEGTLTPELAKQWREFHRDVAVLAIPVRRSQLYLTDIEGKALYQRAPYSSQPGIKPHFPTAAEYPPTPAAMAVAPQEIIDLTSRLQPDGRLAWDVPPGEWTILRFARTATGQTTRPAPAAGLGFETDKFNPAALEDHFAHYPGPLLKELGPEPKQGRGLTTLHFDSWEMSSQNWSGNFRADFQKHRGYDPLPFLPAMTGRVVGSEEQTERFLWDLRQTAQELVITNHVTRLRELGRQHGLSFSLEPYDMNPNADLSLGAVADVPMSEFWWRGEDRPPGTSWIDTSYSVLEAVSIAHTGGKPIVAAEAFTSNPGEDWMADPAAIKGVGDWAFAAGLNRLAIHRYQHQPWLDRWPGMTMWEYGVHWERTQTWWPMASAFHEYLARCQFMLRQGQPVADILYLAREGAPMIFRPPSSATVGKRPDRRGYNFDGCAPEVLRERARVEAGRLVFPDGMSYRALVLPENETMTPELLRTVHALVQAGATVIGPRPAKSPSLAGFPGSDAEVRRLAAELWGPCDGVNVKEHAFGAGRVIWDASAVTPVAAGLAPEPYGDYAFTAGVLARQGLPPDFESDGPVRYTHRRTDDSDIYFVANREARTLEARCDFRVSGRIPELWDPLTGERRRLPDFSTVNGRTRVPLRFAPEQSFFIVFRDGNPAPTGDRNFATLRTVSEVSGPWEVSFDPKWGGPEKINFDRLEDWTLRTEPDIRHYSGTAVYRKRFELDSALLRDRSAPLLLDLGTVKNLARVRLNGRDLGVVWCAPWQVDISAAAQAGRNELEITVANLWPNRLIGDQGLPPEKRRTWVSINPFKADSPLLPSGLLGPVTLQTTLK